MPLNLPYDVQDQVIILPIQARGCQNFLGTVEKVTAETCCVTDATGGTTRVRGVSYLVRYQAQITNMCNPDQSQCVIECKEFCQDELQLVTNPPVP